MNKKCYFTLITVIWLKLCVFTVSANAHCQLPCGIYDDNARVKMMLEDADLIEKAMNELQTLTKKDDARSKNQLTRWVMNKEKHADNIISIITDYFLTQRVNPEEKNYEQRFAKHHKIILVAVKVKQNVDGKLATELKKSITELLSYYPEHNH